MEGHEDISISEFEKLEGSHQAKVMEHGFAGSVQLRR